MRAAIRRFHRSLAPFIFPLVAVSAVTGVAYRAGKKWCGMDGQTGQALMEWHTGEWLGPALSPLYVLLVGCALLFLLFSGAAMLWQKAGAGQVRLGHRILGAAMLLPLTATAVTGVLYKFGQAWFGISEETADILMTIHEGGWLGKSLKAYYSVVVGGGLFGLGILGLALMSKRKPRKRH